ncbi:MAG: hypothetical protein ACLT46_16105 [Hungatella sp.]
MEKDKGDKMYLKKTELEQALRENMQSTLESYGGDSIAEDAICFCYDSMLAVIKQLGKDKREIMSEEEGVDSAFADDAPSTKILTCVSMVLMQQKQESRIAKMRRLKET